MGIYLSIYFTPSHQADEIECPWCSHIVDRFYKFSKEKGASPPCPKCGEKFLIDDEVMVFHTKDLAVVSFPPEWEDKIGHGDSPTEADVYDIQAFLTAAYAYFLRHDATHAAYLDRNTAIVEKESVAAKRDLDEFMKLKPSLLKGLSKFKISYG